MVVETILNTRPTAREKVWAGVVDFIAALDAVPGWSEWRKHKITYTLDFDGSLETEKRGDPLNEFSFSNEIERQHAVVMGFLTLADGVASLKECEFYFAATPSTIFL